MIGPELQICMSCKQEYPGRYFSVQSDWCIFCREDYVLWESKKHKNKKPFEPVVPDWTNPNSNFCGYCNQPLLNGKNRRIRQTGKNCEDQEWCFHNNCSIIMDSWKSQDIDAASLVRVMFEKIPIETRYTVEGYNFSKRPPD